MDTTFALVLGATAAGGLLAGASLDQSVKQLPARDRMGAIAYSQYSRASDLGNGILLYGVLGLGAALLSIAAAVSAYRQGVPSLRANIIYVGALFAVLHSLATTQAAPTILGQRRVAASDEAALGAVFNRFTRWQSIRCILQVVNFAVNLWALIVYTK